MTAAAAPSPAGLQAFVINLDRSPERLAAMRQRLARTGLPWERVPAVDGRALDLARCAEVDIPGYERRHGKRLNPGEAGCYLSHVAVLRRFLDSPHTHALVLEDDADFPADFTPLLRRLLAHGGEWDVVKLSGAHSGTPLKVAPLGGRYALAVPLTPHMNSNAIVLNRRAAQVLLRRLLPMRLPYDHALERAWRWGLRLRIVTPTPCPADTAPGSTIGAGAAVRHLKFPPHKRLPAYAFRLRNALGRLRAGLWQAARARRGASSGVAR